MMMPTSKLAALLLAGMLAAVTWAVPAGAAAEGDIRFERPSINRLDQQSLQRGARVFVNHCLNCHSAHYMRYNRLTDLGLTEDQIRANLMFATDKVGETMAVAMPSADAKKWFGAPPPDLSVEARVRGKEWLYNYFLGFYRDDSAPSGWNNLVFPNVGMPHVLWEQGGTNALKVVEFEDREKAAAAALAARELAVVAPAGDHRFELRTLVVERPGTLEPAEYRRLVGDLVNYLDYMAEPAKARRINLGLVVLLYLGVLFGFAYWMKRTYWKDLH